MVIQWDNGGITLMSFVLPSMVRCNYALVLTATATSTAALSVCGIGRNTIIGRDVSPWRRIRPSTSRRPFGDGRVQRITGSDIFDHSLKGREGSEIKRSPRQESTESRFCSFR